MFEFIVLNIKASSCFVWEWVTAGSGTECSTQFKCNEINFCNLVYLLFDRFSIWIFCISNSILSWQSMTAWFLPQWHCSEWKCWSGLTFYPDYHVSITRISLVHDARRWHVMMISGATTLVTYSVLTEMSWRQLDNKWFTNSRPIGMNCYVFGCPFTFRTTVSSTLSPALWFLTRCCTC